MKKFILFPIVLCQYFAIILKAQEVKVLDFHYESLKHSEPQSSATCDKYGNLYYDALIVAPPEDSIRKDSAVLYKRNPQGRILWERKFGSRSVGASSVITNIQCYDSLIYVLLNYSVKTRIYDTVLVAPTPIDPLNPYSSNVLIITNLDGKLKKIQSIGYGTQLIVNNILKIDSSNIIFNAIFSRDINLSPCGGNLIEIPSNSLYNFAWIKLKKNLSFDTIQLSRFQGSLLSPGYNADNNLKYYLFSGYFTNEDTMRFSNIKHKTSLSAAPFLFILDKDGKVTKAIYGLPGPVAQPEVGAYTRYAIDDSLGNIYCLLSCYGSFKFAGLVVGKVSDQSHVVVKLDSNGNGIWQKTFTTDGFYAFGNGIRYNRHTNKIWLQGTISDTFTIGGYNFAENPNSRKRVFVARMNKDGNIEFVKIIGYDAPSGGFNYLVQGTDTAGNSYTLLNSSFQFSCKAECFSSPNVPTFSADSLYYIWLKIGPCTLKKDSIKNSWPTCQGSRQIKAFYKSEYGPMKYNWSNGDTGQTFTTNNGGQYKLIVSDGTCCADTQTFQVPFSIQLPQPAITGATAGQQGLNQMYQISVPDSVAIQWAVTGGIIVAGQGTDSVAVLWQTAGFGQLVASVSDVGGFCSKADTLNVLITSGKTKLQASVWQVAPNPTDGQLHIKGKSSAMVSYAVYNVLGKQCLAGKAEGASFGIGIGFLPKGVYQLRLESRDGIWVEKVVKAP